MGSLFFVVLLLSSCTKSNGDTVIIKPEEQAVRYLTGEIGNRVWHLKEAYVNRVPVQLTATQLKYTKTYTQIAGGQVYNGSFADSDGYVGKWTLISVKEIVEVINNNPSGSDLKISWLINKLDAATLDMESIYNGKTTRLVLYAL